MRVFILIALLCNVAFSALYLNGAEYTQIVTINHSQVAETSSDFLFQLKIPRVGNLITAVESADDVAFTNVNDTTRRARWVVYTPDTIFLYSHIAVSSTVDTSYRIQYGKSLNETNASATFTNCGITNFWGMDELSGSTTVDYAGGITGTKYDVDVISGAFNKGLLFKNNAGTSTVICSSPTIGTGDISFFVNFKLKSNKNYHTLINNGKFRVQIWANGTIQVLSDGVTPTTGLLYALNTEEWYCLYINRSANGIVNAWLNGGKVINNGNSGTPALGTVNLEFGRSQMLYSLDGSIDNVSLYSGQINLTSNYNSLCAPSTFSTLGTPLATEFSAEMGIDTLTFTCSATNALTYQWFLDGNPMPGETDSVLVIYADSTFYSTAHTLYCLVNSSVISDSWVITTEFSAEMGIDTLRLVCSAENALTYQWYDNNVPVSGETDSVYTIYADSAFYSIKHVIYCLVNGSVISDSWIIRETSGVLQRLFQRNRGYGRGR